MHITINRLSSGLIATPSKTLVSAFDIDKLPASVRERARVLLTPEQLAVYADKLPSAGGADRFKYEIEFVGADCAKSVRVDEAACPPDLLELLDELMAT